MGRQILAFVAGVLLSILGAAAGGYLLYQVSGPWPQLAPALGLYVLNPIIALFVGFSVGVHAKSRPGFLAALSLVPSNAILLLDRRLTFANLLFMIFLVCVCLLIGAAAAERTFRLRRKDAQVAPST